MQLFLDKAFVNLSIIKDRLSAVSVILSTRLLTEAEQEKYSN